MLLQDSSTEVIARIHLLYAVPSPAAVAVHSSAGDTVDQVRMIVERMGWRQPDKVEVVKMQGKSELWA